MFCRWHRVWFIYYWSESELWYAYIYLRISYIIYLLCVWVIWLLMASCVMQNSLGKAFSPVYLIAPVQIMTWLNQYHDHCQQILRQIKYERKITIYLYYWFFLSFWDNSSGHCTLISEIFTCLFRLPIPSYQNACAGCENAENRTWFEFFLTSEIFGGSVQTRGHIFFLTCKNFGLIVQIPLQLKVNDVN